MAKINVMGDVLMLETELSPDILYKVQKHAPDKLELKDKEGNSYFKVQEGNASISKYGVSFSSVTVKGHLFATTRNVVIGEHTDLEEEKSLILDEYAEILSNLNKVEKQVSEALDDILATAKEVETSINIIGNSAPTE